jgi:hypothetical protein
MILLDTMQGKPVSRAPVVPKIWLDLAANIMERNYSAFFNNPGLSTATVIEAAKKCYCDGARIFLFPRRDIREENGIYWHWKNGRRIGRVDINGGWATILEDPDDFEFEDPRVTICYQLFKCAKPIIREIGDVAKIRVPSLETFHELYDNDVDNALRVAGDSVCPIGDCNSGTLAFCVSMLGMVNAMTSILDEPELLHGLMNKGIELSVMQAKFMIDKGIRILRYNDSVANMNLISPAMWRSFVMPYIKRFCDEVHSYCNEVKIYCHICGNVIPIINDLIDCGLDCIAPLDPLGGFSVGEIRRIVGDSMVLMGGVNTLSFIQKTPEELCKEAEKCIEEGFVNGRYVVGSGCVIPRQAKLEALRALATASRNKAVTQ